MTRWTMAMMGLTTLAACGQAVGTGDAAGADGPIAPTGAPLGGLCLPPRPPRATGEPVCGGGDAGCFSGNEVALQEHFAACASSLCEVYRWDEHAAPDQTQRAFCTCRCAGAPAGEPTCACAADMTCTLAFASGDPAIRGSYCVPSALLR